MATSKIYVSPETPITFADSAQSPSAALTMSALSAGGGRISARFDRGAGAHAAMYKWRSTIQVTGTNVLGEAIEFYLSTSDGSNPDGEIGTADASLPTDKRRNLLYLGSIITDQTTTNTNMTASGVVWVPDRYLSMGIWNACAANALKTDTAVHHISLTPIPEESQ